MGTKINFLWIGNKLGDVEIMSLNSFHRLGYECVLWCYDEIENIPDFVTVSDGNIITQYTGINPILHSDYFRYKLLLEYGGIYSDLDNILLKVIQEQDYIFSSSSGEVNSHFIKAPLGSEIMKNIVDEIESKFPPTGDFIYNGVYLFSKVEKFNLSEFLVNGYDLNLFISGTLKLGVELIDWGNVCVTNIHLFNSSIRYTTSSSELYKLNINNLKDFIYG